MIIEGDFLELGIVSLLVLSVIEIGFWVYICSKISRRISTIMINNTYGDWVYQSKTKGD